jgi:dCTP deaminase
MAEAGILPSQSIEALVASGSVRMEEPLDGDQIQPASLDLRLGSKAWRMRASFLPGPRARVEERIAHLALHEVDLTKGAVLETGCVYVAPLLEGLSMPEHILASTNPKSSTGRLDVFTRVISDHGRAFDQVEAGYDGPLYAEISPRTFPVLVRMGSRLSQIRFRTGDARIPDAELRDVQRRMGLVSTADPDISGGVALSVDLDGFDDGGGRRVVGYRAKRHTGVVDVDRRAACDLLDYWEPIPERGRRNLILDPDEFYILASKEAVHVPPDFAAEMVPFDPLVGEFRVHYAGFFDPGFGHAPDGLEAARAVLEVRSREVPFILEDGQTVGRLVYERMLERPSILYGAGLGSNYQGQALKLSKHFK